MMAHSKASTISLAVDKDSPMRNPLKLPKPVGPPQRGKLYGQIHLTNSAEYSVRYPDAKHKRGTTLFQHNQRTLIRMGLASKNPCLVLPDVLRTKLGRAALGVGSGSQLTEDAPRPAPSPAPAPSPSPSPSPSHHANGRVGPSPLCRGPKAAPRVEEVEVVEEEMEVEKRRRRSDLAPQGHQSPLPSDGKTGARASPRVPERHFSPRRPPERTCQRRGAGGGRETLMSAAHARYSDTGAMVHVHIPLRVRGAAARTPPWPALRRGFHGSLARGRWSDPTGVNRHVSLWRNSGIPEGHRNGATTDAMKGLRQSSLISRPGQWESPALPRPVWLSIDRPVPVEAPSVSLRVPPPHAGEPPACPGLNQEDSGPSDPIVLSSDESESGELVRLCGPVIQPTAGVVQTGSLRKAPEIKPVAQEGHTDTQVEEEDDFPGDHLSAFLVSSLSRREYSCMNLPFHALHSGSYRGNANGNLMIQGQRLLIPLKGSSSRLRVLFAVEFKELRRYSLWEQSGLLGHGLRFRDQPQAPMFLLLVVSYTQALAAQTLLLKLSGRQRTDAQGSVSPFLLLSLRTRAEGVEAAVLRSALEMGCLYSAPHSQEMQAPELSLDESLQFIRSRGLDPQLLSALGAKEAPDSDPELGPDSDPELGPDSDPEPDLEPLWDSDPEPEPELEPEPEPEPETVWDPDLVSDPEAELASDSDPVLVRSPVPELELELELDPPDSPPERAGLLDLHIKVCDPDTGLLTELSTQQTEGRPTQPSVRPPAELGYILCHRRVGQTHTVTRSTPDASWTKFKHRGLPRRLIQFPPPPSKGGIAVTMEDLQRLDNGQYLNDVIIDFYLKYLLDKAPAAVAERSHIFSSFFYKQLTRRDNASEDFSAGAAVSQSLRRHQRVRTWTRHVDIFQKDFLFVPVNQEAHWYLVVICFPGLEEPVLERRTEAGWERTAGDRRPSDPPAQQEAPGPPELNDPAAASASPPPETGGGPTERICKEAAHMAPPGLPTCTEQSCQRDTVCKRPCILIMDSLKLSQHERIFKLMREYLQAEWEVRRGTAREFGPEQVEGSHCRVPLQDNCSDCGLYLLQYVESFLKDPVLHFDLPLRLERWFPRQQVRRKRDEIRDLVIYLYRLQQQKPAGAT